LRNCIFWANSRNDEVDQFTQFCTSDPYKQGSINNCCIQGWTGEFEGVETFGDEPLFVDVNGLDGIAATEDDNFRLVPQSPCVDAGDSQFVPTGILTDIDGYKRTLLGNVDMGPYEYFTMLVDDDADGDPAPNDPSSSDPEECGSPAHPFDTIQEALNAVEPGYTIVVEQGSYPDSNPYGHNNIDFKGKNCILRSADPNNWDVVNKTHINSVVLFAGSEDPNCMLLGFKVHNLNNSCIYGRNSKATISNCNMSGNTTCRSTVMRDCDGLINNCLISDNYTSGGCALSYVINGCEGTIRNCTIANNISGVKVGSAKIENTIIYNNQNSQLEVDYGCVAEISYCNIQGGLEGIVGSGDVIGGLGNIDVDPCFVRLGQWDVENFVLYEGNYHLQSYGWRVEEDSPLAWTYDYLTSRCIDAGNPGYPIANEPKIVPNDLKNDFGANRRINMGAFGGTNQASMAPTDWALLADLNNDGLIDWQDFSSLTQNWLGNQVRNPADLDRNGIINMKDYVLMTALWRLNAGWRR